MTLSPQSENVNDEWAQPQSALKLTAMFSDEVRDAMSRRNAAIIWARKYGATLRSIADASKLTPQGVAKIISRKYPKQLDN